ncbi:MAG: hypothetical protein ACO1SX_27510 [Actinomycetota bacterium]
MGRFLGITVLADFVQNEGVEQILENVARRAGATAVACNPTVTAPGDAAHGSWQPPADAGASVRLFDRPLWGQRELWVRSAPSFSPTPGYYSDTPYSPRRPKDLTATEGPIVGHFLTEAKAAGLKFYLQVGAAQPPGLRAEDTPRLPDGRTPVDRMADTGSLASPALRAYNRAYVRDLFDHYPEMDGLRIDWPEYPCYKLDEVFQDFGDPVRDWALAHGFDFEAIRAEALSLYRHLHGDLTNADLTSFQGLFPLLQTLRDRPMFLEWLRLKAELSADLIGDWRDAVRVYGGAGKELSANAFMPPFSLLTGLDFARAAARCDSISAKLYTMHWALMVRFWGDALMAANAGLDEALLVRTLVSLLDLSDGEPGARLSDYDYPGPDQPHPIPNGPQLRKIGQARTAIGSRVPFYALVHGYGPVDDFRRRLQLVADSQVDGVWINRYGYLSDEKLDVIREVWR